MRGLGYCQSHYMRLWRHGDPLAGGKSKTPRGEVQAFFESMMLLDTQDCIIWPYAAGTVGHGVMRVDGQQVSVTRLACERKWGPPGEGVEAAHGPCHNPRCFNPRHLSWKTTSENAMDKHRDGTMSLGSLHGMSKLTEDDVLEIRRLAESGMVKRRIAERFGISATNVTDITLRHTWKHV